APAGGTFNAPHSVGERQPVDVDEVGRLAAGERQIHGVHAGGCGDVPGYRAPRLPAARVGDREAPDRRVGAAVQPYLDQPAHPAGRPGGDARGELVGGTAAEVDVVELQPVAVADPAHVEPALGAGLGLGAALRVGVLGLDRPVGRSASAA